MYKRQVLEEREIKYHPQSVMNAKMSIPFAVGLVLTDGDFGKGHRIRLEIASSNFPKWDRNLNTGHPMGQDAEMRTALQKVYHDAEHPSHVLLPVIPAKQG